MKITFSLFSLLLIASLLLSSCIQKSERSTTPPESGPDTTIVTPEEPEELEEPLAENPSGNAPTVDVAVYVEYPEGIDGCACYFGRNATELSEARYIFMTNYDKKAYMKLDGEMREFDLISSTDLEDGRLMETWKNKNYNMVVKSKETGSIDETWQRIGTINIKPKNKDATMIGVVGECGC
ncbi:MAG: hypothetical protein AB8B56_21340 [Crocinitomicaceae bacterium]